jgi:hypothetical protein
MASAASNELLLRLRAFQKLERETAIEENRPSVPVASEPGPRSNVFSAEPSFFLVGSSEVKSSESREATTCSSRSCGRHGQGLLLSAAKLRKRPSSAFLEEGVPITAYRFVKATPSSTFDSSSQRPPRTSNDWSASSAKRHNPTYSRRLSCSPPKKNSGRPQCSRPRQGLSGRSFFNTHRRLHQLRSMSPRK